MYHSVKASLPEWFDNWNPFDPAIQEFLKSGVFLPLPGYDKKGRFVALSRLGKMNPVLGTPNDFIKGMWMILVLAMDGDEQTSLKGFVDVTDFAGCGLSQVSMFDFSFFKKFMTVIENQPLKVKAEHLLNLPRLMESANNMYQKMKKNQKMRDRSLVHKAGDLSRLQEDVGLDILPREYGGTNGTIEELTNYWKKRAEDSKEALIIGSFRHRSFNSIVSTRVSTW